jgi:hypothetical protein
MQKISKFLIEKVDEYKYWAGNTYFVDLDIKSPNIFNPHNYLPVSDGIYFNQTPKYPYIFDTYETALYAMNYVPRNISVRILELKLTVELEECL